MALRVGDPAPAFSGISTDGSPLSLAQFGGRKLVLYFYPMDDTPGCTAQACSLRDHNQEIAARGAAIVGVSAQGQASHQRFTDRYRLNFPLLADTGQKVANAYGAGSPGPFGFALGMLGMTRRITFIIDETGHIAHIIDHPDCANHGAEVLKFI